MDIKGILKAITLELRHELEGRYDAQDNWQAGDLERRLAAIGVRRDRASLAVDELPHLALEDREARRVVDAFLDSRAEAGQKHEDGIAEFVRDAAYTWANRLLALRCMEARGLIDEVILKKDAYGGRSLQHNRLARKQPERCAGEDEGLYAVLFDEFTGRVKELPLLFDPNAPEVALRPSVAALKRCIALLSGTLAGKGQEAVTDEVFTAPDAFGWTYQYWDTEEKDRIFEKVRTKKDAKIEGTDIIPATCIYTEPYMVKFLVQNSLGALWMGMHPASQAIESWEYYVRSADRVPVANKPVADITFLDPACGSGHFLIEAFELFYLMYLEEGVITDAAEICASILERNLYGIDIDERAIQIAALALVMKAKEKSPSFVPRRVNLVATNIHLPNKKERLEAFLAKHPEDAQLKPALLVIFEALAHADELGSLLQIEEPVTKELQALQAKYEASGSPAEQTALWRQMQKPVQGKLPLGVESYEAWKERTLARIREHFEAEATAADLSAAFFGEAGVKGVSLLELLSRRYDVVAANPPYLGKRKLGELVRRYLARNYKAGSEDLYSAFLHRALSLLAPGGHLAFVTMAGYAYLPPFTALRELILQQTSIEILAFLGPYAFPEMRDHVNAILTITSRQQGQGGSVCIINAEEESDKARSLCQPELRAMIERQLFKRLPGCAFAYWFDERLLSDYSRHNKLVETSVVSLGLSAIDNARFYRRRWEVQIGSHLDSWIPLMKGGQYDKWSGPCHWAVRWRADGLNWKSLFDQKYPYAAGNYDWKIHDQEVFFKRGVCYTNASSWGMGARELLQGALFEDTSPGVFTELSPEATMCLLNSRAFHLYAALVNPSVHLQPGDVRQIPVPIPDGLLHETLKKLGRFAIHAKDALLGYEIAAVQFDEKTLVPMDSSLKGAWRESTSKRLRHEALLGWVDGLADYISTKTFLTERCFEILTSLVTVPTGWQPIACSDLCALLRQVGLQDVEVRELAAVAQSSGFEDKTLRAAEAPDTKAVLRRQFEEGSGILGSNVDDLAEADDNSNDEDTQPSQPGESIHTSLRMLDQSWVEAMSRRVALNPLAVGITVANGVTEESWTNKDRLADYCCDLISCYVLKLLGHRWPREIEAGETVLCWAGADGIIPITDNTGESSLLALVRERIAEDFGAARAGAVEREFEEIMGKPLSTWLASDLFKHHISQFRKRPIALQVASSAPNGERRRSRIAARNAPAFSCLVYYHRFDADLLPKLRTQYIGPVRMSMQTELGSLERLRDRTADQDARRLELENKLEELKDFDTRLERVIVEGFASATLDKVTAKEPLDKWISRDGRALAPETRDGFVAQERRYDPDLNDGVRVNIAPFQRAGLLAADVLAAKDVEKAIADRAEWRADERRWCREGKLPNPGWWEGEDNAS